MQRLDVAGRQRVEQALVHREVQHHLQPVAELAEVLAGSRPAARSLPPAGSRRGGATAGSRASRAGARSPCVRATPAPLRSIRNGTASMRKPRHAELQPEPHDPHDLLAHGGVVRYSGPAESRRSGGSSTRPRPRRASRSSSARRETPSPCCSPAAASSTRRTSRGTATPDPCARAWNHGCRSEV